MIRVLQKAVCQFILAALILAQIVWIIFYYSQNFTEYVSAVLIILVIPITYYSYKLINVAGVSAEYIVINKSQASKQKEDITKLTNEEVNKLTSSNAFKEYERWKEAESERKKRNGEEQLDKETEQIAKQLEDLEKEIFTDDEKNE